MKTNLTQQLLQHNQQFDQKVIGVEQQLSTKLNSLNQELLKKLETQVRFSLLQSTYYQAKELATERDRRERLESLLNQTNSNFNKKLQETEHSLVALIEEKTNVRILNKLIDVKFPDHEPRFKVIEKRLGTLGKELSDVEKAMKEELMSQFQVRDSNDVNIAFELR